MCTKQCDVQPHKQPCFSFLCCKDKFFGAIQKFVGSFHHQLSANNLKAGTLLMFSSDQCSSSVTCFLGVVLKKPQQHMLVEASVADGETQEAFLTLENGAPKIFTSHEIFSKFFREKLGRQPLTIKAEAWKCQAFLHNGHQLKSNPEDQIATLTLSEKPMKKTAAKKKVVRKLPFGMEAFLRRKRGGKKKHTKAAPKAGNKSKRAAMAAMTKPDAVGTTSSSSSTSSSSDNDEQQDQNPEEESEHVMPATDTIESQQNEIKRLAAEVADMDQLAQAATSRAKSGSFFNSDLGLIEGAIAVSNRSICYHCRTVIPKGLCGNNNVAVKVFLFVS